MPLAVASVFPISIDFATVNTSPLAYKMECVTRMPAEGGKPINAPQSYLFKVCLKFLLLANSTIE